jgi:hypothetical protein
MAAQTTDPIDQMRRELDDYQGRIQDTYLLPLDRWSTSKVEERVAAAEGLAPAAVVRAVKALLVEAEQWYGAWHDRAVVETAAALGVAAERWLLPATEKGWLRMELADALGALQSALGALHAAAVASARFSSGETVGEAVETVDASQVERSARGVEKAMQQVIAAALGAAGNIDARVLGAVEEFDRAASAFHKEFNAVVVARVNGRMLPTVREMQRGAKKP